MLNNKIKFFNKRNLIFRLFKESELEKSRLFILSILTILLTFTESLFLGLVAPITNSLLNNDLPQNLSILDSKVFDFLNSPRNILTLLIVALIVKSYLQAFKTFYISKINLIIRKRLRIKIIKNFLSKKIKNGNYSGKTFDMYFTSSSISSKVVIHIFDLIINSLYILAALIILITNFSFKLILFLFVGFLLYLIIFKVLKRYSDLLSKLNQKIFQIISENVSQIIKGYREIRIYSLEKKSLSKISDHENSLVNSMSKTRLLNFIPSLLPPFILVLVILFAFSQSNDSSISKQTSEILILLIIVQRCGGFLGIIGSKFTAIRLGRAHIKYLLEGIEIKDQGELSNIKKSAKINFIDSIDFVNVNFSFGELKTFENLSLTINSGKINLLIGKSGSGKSTLFSLLLKENNIDKGEILINKNNINKFSEKEIYQNISLLPQEPYIFADSILENIRIAKPEASINEIIDCIKISGAFEFINKLPDKLNTVLSEGGINLSGGQKQLISLSRIVLSNSKAILLDEPTNNLDEISIIRLKKLLKIWAQENKLILINTHDYRLISERFEKFEIKDKKIKKFLFQN